MKSKKWKPQKIAKNAKKWQTMAGKDEMEKRVNSYLTCQFILHQDIPDDECLHEARAVIKIIHECIVKEIVKVTKAVRKTNRAFPDSYHYRGDD